MALQGQSSQSKSIDLLVASTSVLGAACARSRQVVFCLSSDIYVKYVYLESRRGLRLGKRERDPIKQMDIIICIDGRVLYMDLFDLEAKSEDDALCQQTNHLRCQKR